MSGQGGQTEKPDLETYSRVPMFNTKAVVQLTGVSAPTLRAWERRYTLLSPERASNTYRLYSERDVAIISWLKGRVDAGMTISQAIALFYYNYGDATHKISTPESQSHIVLRSTHSTHNIHVKADKPEDGPPVIPLIPLQDEQLDAPFPSEDAVHLMQKHLIDAFRHFDKAQVDAIMKLMLTAYSVEQVCVELITPTMWQIGQLWADGSMPVPVENFASTFFRNMLLDQLHTIPMLADVPSVVVCCVPGELHELAPLMLALCLGRSGLHVVYLGSGVSSEGLLQIVGEISPSLVCASLTVPASLSSLIELAHKFKQLAPPRPIFAFGGQVFAYNAHLLANIPGMYVEGNLNQAVYQLRSLIV